MKIPEYLIKEILRKKVVLVLGAGASKGSRNKDGNEPPDANELAKMLSEQFLAGKYNKQDLIYVSEIAISEAGLFEVQDFIADIFNQFEPANFHEILSNFYWRGLATTNYDVVLEKSYNNNSERTQNLRPIISNYDKIDDIIRSEKDLPYLKLHGCVTRTHDENIPLVLTPEQVISIRTKRNRIYELLENWGYENTFVFIGHGLKDTDIRQILMNLNILGDKRPMYYLLTPKINDEEMRLWQSKRVSIIEGSFKEFLENLDKNVAKKDRVLQKLVHTSHPIEKEFTINVEMSEDCYDFIRNEADYVSENLPIRDGSPQAFYRGFDLGWYPIQNNLDVSRKLIDTILFDKVLSSEEDRPSVVEFYVIKAEAGAGKSIFLKRLSWTAAIHGDCICIFIRRYGQLKYDPLNELHRLTGKRIFVFIDDAADNLAPIEDFIIKATQDKIPITLFSAERINEWNVSCENIESYVTEDYRLPYLNSKEIKNLVVLLEENNCLGYLKDLTLEERIRSFEKKAGRQLLVALHETTLGKPFEEIIVDEYNEIKPQIAQSIYLTVCILNRMNVLVRAGLISRMYDIPFYEFKKRLFSPLEHVVQVISKSATDDYYYAARHSHIAEIVFENILRSEDERFNEYVKILNNINISYNSDRDSYRNMIKGKNLINLFPSYQTVIQLYNLIEERVSDDPYFYQQQGIYEMNRRDGNLGKAEQFFNKARELGEDDNSIIHSIAELNRLRAEGEDNSYKKEQFRNNSRKLLSKLMLDNNSRKHAITTLVKINNDELKEILTKDNPNPIEIERLTNQIESRLSDGFKEFPGDSYLLVAEHDFHKLLKEEKKAVKALEKAFKANNHLSFIANRLAKIYYENGELDDAIKITNEALDSKPNEKFLHYNLALLLRNKKDIEIDKIIYHLKRSFTKWDKNIYAQFWYARFCFESEDLNLYRESKDVFKRLRNAPINYSLRHEIQDKIMENNKPKIFTGKIVQKQETIGKIRRDKYSDFVFMHKNNIGKIWHELQDNILVNFEIGFDFGGPIALNLYKI